MSKFLGRLSVIELNSVANSGRGTWKLLTDLSFQSDTLKAFYLAQGKNEADAEALSVVTAPAGFVTDFMSVPPEVPNCAMLARSRRAGSIHDYLYTKKADGSHVLPQRSLCDSILKEMFIEDVTEDGGADSAVDKMILETEASLVWQGVRLGGGSHY